MTLGELFITVDIQALCLGFPVIESVNIDLVLALLVIAVAIAGWEWKKILRDKKAETDLTRELSSLKVEMKTLHEDHQKLLRSRDGEHAEIMRKMTRALDNLNGGINELTHYIKWLGTETTGHNPPPPLSKAKT